MLKVGVDLSKAKKKKVKISNLKQGPLRHEKLPDSFIERIIKYKNILKEVETSSLEEAVSNFQRDLNPDIELEIWEAIAEYYQNKLIDYPYANLEEKKELFKRVLLGTMG